MAKPHVQTPVASLLLQVAREHVSAVRVLGHEFYVLEYLALTAWPELVLLISVGVVPLIHNLGHRIKLAVDVLDFEFGVGDYYKVFNHFAKVVVAHHQVLEGLLFRQLQNQI